MNKDNCVVFKGTGKGIAIVLSENASFDDIKTVLAAKIEASSKFFEGVTTGITLKGKAISEDEEQELIEIISEKLNMNISFLKTDTDTNNTSAVLTKDLKDCSFTKYHKGSIRSGQVLSFEGSIVIVGDVNPGAVVKARGNITV